MSVGLSRKIPGNLERPRLGQKDTVGILGGPGAQGMTLPGAGNAAMDPPRPPQTFKLGQFLSQGPHLRFHVRSICG